MAREVVCATKDPSGPNDCRCIEEIGVDLTTVGFTIKKSPKEVHEDIASGTDYFVEYNGSKTEVIAAERDGTKYVRTEPNDTEDDNLLKIGSC